MQSLEFPFGGDNPRIQAKPSSSLYPNGAFRKLWVHIGNAGNKRSNLLGYTSGSPQNLCGKPLISKLHLTALHYSILGIYRDNGKENGSYYSIIGCYITLGFRTTLVSRPRSLSSSPLNIGAYSANTHPLKPSTLQPSLYTLYVNLCNPQTATDMTLDLR